MNERYTSSTINHGRSYSEDYWHHDRIVARGLREEARLLRAKAAELERKADELESRGAV